MDQQPFAHPLISERRSRSVMDQRSFARRSRSVMECPICLEAIKKPHVLNCGHQLHYSCLRRYLRQCVSNAERLSCPFPDCGEPINPRGIVSVGTQEENQRMFLRNYAENTYEEASVIVREALNIGVRCPIDKCNGIVSHNICNRCGAQICPSCGELWHDGDCANEIVQSSKFINDSLSKCPLCKVRCERKSGCDHATCPSCATEFSFENNTIMRISEKVRKLLHSHDIYLKEPGIGATPDVVTQFAAIDDNVDISDLVSPLYKCNHPCENQCLLRQCCRCAEQIALCRTCANR